MIKFRSLNRDAADNLSDWYRRRALRAYWSSRAQAPRTGRECMVRDVVVVNGRRDDRGERINELSEENSKGYRQEVSRCCANWWCGERVIIWNWFRSDWTRAVRFRSGLRRGRCSFHSSKIARERVRRRVRATRSSRTTRESFRSHAGTESFLKSFYEILHVSTVPRYVSNW